MSDNPREHDPRCHALCDYAGLSVIEDSEYDCPNGHTVPHDCTCDEIHAARIEALAESYAEMTQ